MTMWEESPDDEPDEAPVGGRARRRFMQIVVTIAITALVLPGVLVTWVTQVRTAQYACEIATDYYAPGAGGSIARFSLTPISVAGWKCYAVLFDGTEFFVAHLGVIPGAPRLVPLTGT
jgi:hypothetical protein